MQLDRTIKSYKIAQRMAARVYNRSWSPVNELPSINDDVINKLGEAKPLKYIKK